jgi:hypothetical protein
VGGQVSMEWSWMSWEGILSKGCGKQYFIFWDKRMEQDILLWVQSIDGERQYLDCEILR